MAGAGIAIMGNAATVAKVPTGAIGDGSRHGSLGERKLEKSGQGLFDTAPPRSLPHAGRNTANHQGNTRNEKG